MNQLKQATYLGHIISLPIGPDARGHWCSQLVQLACCYLAYQHPELLCELWQVRLYH